MDKTSSIFNNPQPKKVIKGANKSKVKYIKKYGDDSNVDYKISFKSIPTLDFIGADNIVFGLHVFGSKFPVVHAVVNRAGRGSSCRRCILYSSMLQ